MNSPLPRLMAGFDPGTIPDHTGADHNLLDTTRHLPSRHMARNYRIMRDHGITWVRDGLFNGGGISERLREAKLTRMNVIWDAIHFHDVDVELAEWMGKEIANQHYWLNGYTDLWLCPLNEIETHAWMRGTGIDGAAALWHAVRDGARYVLGDRVRCVGSCVLNSVDGPWDGIDAIADACGVVGINVYPHTTREFVYDLLRAIHDRTGKPLMITETGAHTGHPDHHSSKSEWLRYVMDEVDDAKSHGIPVWSTCLYPIANCTRWDRTQNDEWDHGLIRLDGSLDMELSAAIKEITK